jgi:hypothetical protein
MWYNLPMFHPRPDQNRKEIVDVWRTLGCIWIDADEFAGCDGFLLSPLGVHIVEIKNPRTYWSLTPREEKRKQEVEQMGHVYNIILRPEDAAILAGYSWGDYLEARQK